MGKKSKNKFRSILIKEEKEMENQTNMTVESEVKIEGQTVIQEGVTVPEVKVEGETVIQEGVTVSEQTENIEESPEEPVQTEEESMESTEEENIPVTKVGGKLSNCARLYVRKEASKESDVVTILTDKDIVIIDLEGSTDDFYKIEFNEFGGYCVKKFIQEITE